MLLPGDITYITNLAATQARAEMAALPETTGAAEGARAVEDFAKRGTHLAATFAAGNMTLDALRKALESEREALTYTLAAITKENRRGILLALLDGALQFLARLAGAR